MPGPSAGETASAPLAATDADGRSRSGWVRVAIGTVVVLTAGELGARAVADGLPPRQIWATPEAQFKVEQIDDLEEPGVDVLFTGSSVVDAGVDPLRFDQHLRTSRGSYNASLGAGSPEMVRFFTVEVSLPRLAPEVVVVGITSRDVNGNDPAQDELEERWRSSPAVEHLSGKENLIDRLDRILSERSALVEHRAELRSPRNLLGRGRPAWGDVLTGPAGQYRQFLDQRFAPSQRQLDFIRSGPLRDWEPDDAKIDDFRSLLRAAAASDAVVLLVDMPTTATFRALHPHGERDVSRYEALVDALAREGDVPLVRAGVWPDALFADALHLNESGVTQLTQLLAEEVGRRWSVPRVRT